METNIADRGDDRMQDRYYIAGRNETVEMLRTLADMLESGRIKQVSGAVKASKFTVEVKMRSMLGIDFPDTKIEGFRLTSDAAFLPTNIG